MEIFHFSFPLVILKRKGLIKLGLNPKGKLILANYPKRRTEIFAFLEFCKSNLRKALKNDKIRESLLEKNRMIAKSWVLYFVLVMLFDTKYPLWVFCILLNN